MTSVNSSRDFRRTTIVLAATAVILSLVAFGIFVVQVWPPRLLLLTGSETSSLSVASRLTAEAAMRNSILSALGGLVAAGVAFAAIRQASLARKVHEHQKSIDWSKAFAEASKMLIDDKPTYRVSGVIALRALAGTVKGSTSVELIAATLASFVRNAAGRGEDAVLLALQFICENRGEKIYSLEGAQLSKMDLTAFSFEGLALKGTSFRDASISKAQRELLSGLQGVDLGGVNWR
jgi:hypothetical protein